MPITRIFSIYDESGEKAIVTLTAETVEDDEDVCEIAIYAEGDDYIGTFTYDESLKIREVK
jgi:hypothetical protein